jgi:hypothetical protein
MKIFANQKRLQRLGTRLVQICDRKLYKMGFISLFLRYRYVKSALIIQKVIRGILSRLKHQWIVNEIIHLRQSWLKINSFRYFYRKKMLFTFFKSLGTVQEKMDLLKYYYRKYQIVFFQKLRLLNLQNMNTMRCQRQVICFKARKHLFVYRIRLLLLYRLRKRLQQSQMIASHNTRHRVIYILGRNVLRMKRSLLAEHLILHKHHSRFIHQLIHGAIRFRVINNAYKTSLFYTLLKNFRLFQKKIRRIKQSKVKRLHYEYITRKETLSKWNHYAKYKHRMKTIVRHFLKNVTVRHLFLTWKHWCHNIAYGLNLYDRGRMKAYYSRLGQGLKWLYININRRYSERNKLNQCQYYYQLTRLYSGFQCFYQLYTRRKYRQRRAITSSHQQQMTSAWSESVHSNYFDFNPSDQQYYPPQLNTSKSTLSKRFQMTPNENLSSSFTFDQNHLNSKIYSNTSDPKTPSSFTPLPTVGNTRNQIKQRSSSVIDDPLKQPPRNIPNAHSTSNDVSIGFNAPLTSLKPTSIRTRNELQPSPTTSVIRNARAKDDKLPTPNPLSIRAQLLRSREENLLTPNPISNKSGKLKDKEVFEMAKSRDDGAVINFGDSSSETRPRYKSFAPSPIVVPPNRESSSYQTVIERDANDNRIINRSLIRSKSMTSFHLPQQHKGTNVTNASTNNTTNYYSSATPSAATRPLRRTLSSSQLHQGYDTYADVAMSPTSTIPTPLTRKSYFPSFPSQYNNNNLQDEEQSEASDLRQVHEIKSKMIKKFRYDHRVIPLTTSGRAYIRSYITSWRHYHHVHDMMRIKYDKISMLLHRQKRKKTLRHWYAKTYHHNKRSQMYKRLFNSLYFKTLRNVLMTLKCHKNHHKRKRKKYLTITKLKRFMMILFKFWNDYVHRIHWTRHRLQQSVTILHCRKKYQGLYHWKRYWKRRRMHYDCDTVGIKHFRYAIL